MKKFQFMALLLAAALSTACQRSLDREDSQSFDGEKGYVSLSLNLPTVSGTKADEEFDDGDASEYKVNDAVIAFFYGADEATAVCKYAISIDEADGILAGPADDNITRPLLPAPSRSLQRRRTRMSMLSQSLTR